MAYIEAKLESDKELGFLWEYFFEIVYLKMKELESMIDVVYFEKGVQHTYTRAQFSLERQNKIT